MYLNCGEVKSKSDVGGVKGCDQHLVYYGIPVLNLIQREPSSVIDKFIAFVAFYFI